MPNKVSQNRKKKMINGFTVFLDEKHQEYARKRIFCSKGDIVASARAEWNNKTKAEQAGYENRAKRQKAKLLADDTLKCDSFGRVIADVKAEDTARESERIRKRKKAASVVNEALSSGKFKSRPFVLVHFNVLCSTGDTPAKHIPCEMGAVKFSFEKGVITYYHSLINPGELPLGYASDIRLITEKTHQLTPSDYTPYNNYLSIKLNLARLVEKSDSGEYDPVYVIGEHMERSTYILDFIHEKARTHRNEKNLFDALYVEDLMRNLVDNGANFLESVGVKSEPWILADGPLRETVMATTYDFAYHTSCDIHEEKGIQTYCALGYAIHRALLICKFMCPLLRIEMRTGRHFPPIVASKAAENAVTGATWKTKAAEKARREQPSFSDWELEDTTPTVAAGNGFAAPCASEWESEGGVGFAIAHASMYDVDAEYRKDGDEEEDEWGVVPTRRWTDDLRCALP